MNKDKLETVLEKVTEKVTFPSILALLLVAGGFSLAIMDVNSRPSFSNLASIGLSGYLTQLIPKKGKSEDKD